MPISSHEHSQDGARSPARTRGSARRSRGSWVKGTRYGSGVATPRAASKAAAELRKEGIDAYVLALE